VHVKHPQAFAGLGKQRDDSRNILKITRRLKARNGEENGGRISDKRMRIKESNPDLKN
jgi:hypothetical protein